MIGKVFRDHLVNWKVFRVNRHHPTLWDAHSIDEKGKIDTSCYMTVSSERIVAQEVTKS